MHCCRECEVILTEGRNWHAFYAARNYRHCMECARAYSRRRYGRIKPTVKRGVAIPAGGKAPETKREWAVRNRAALAKARRKKAKT